MSLDLLAKESADAAYLVARLCEEAGVCLHDPEGNRVEIHAATYDVESGLIVKDRQGRTWRLRVSAEPIAGQPDPEHYDEAQGACPECGAMSYTAFPQGDRMRVDCADCAFAWTEPID